MDFCNVINKMGGIYFLKLRKKGIFSSRCIFRGAQLAVIIYQKVHVSLCPRYVQNIQCNFSLEI